MALTLSQDELDELKISPQVAWYMQDWRLENFGAAIPLPKYPPAIKTPEPIHVPGAMFDAERVDRVLLAFENLRHTKGRWARKPLKPDPWQVAYIIAPTFGWVHPVEVEDEDGDYTEYVRIINNLYVEVPRKNGKTTIAGGLAMYLTAADSEDGAEVYALAAAKDQARRTFDPVKQIATKSPALKGKVKCVTDKIIVIKTASYFQVVASVADLLMGGNVHGAIIDELHVHKKPDLVETVETGTGSRQQPLIVIITTADENKPDTIYDRKRTLIENLADGLFKDETTYGVVWAASKDDDPFSVETQKKANPGFGISPTAKYLKDAAVRAQNSPTELASYKRLHLGIRTQQSGVFIELPVWDKNAGMVNESKLVKRKAYGGLDLASVADLTALAWLFPNDTYSEFDVLWRVWYPREQLEKLNARTAGAATTWVNQGLLTLTPGGVTDYSFVRKQINEDRKKFKVHEIAYDPWNAQQLVSELENDRAEMVEIRQGPSAMSTPTKALLRYLLEGSPEHPTIRHGGNPIARWCVNNFVVREDANGNVRPDRAESRDKIDLIVALIMALGLAIPDTPVIKPKDYIKRSMAG